MQGQAITGYRVVVEGDLPLDAGGDGGILGGERGVLALDLARNQVGLGEELERVVLRLEGTAQANVILPLIETRTATI